MATIPVDQTIQNKPFITVPPPTPDVVGLLGTTQGAIDYTTNLAKTATESQNKVQESQSGITDIMNQILGKTADTQAANESSGLNAATKQLNDLNAQASSLNRAALAIPIQTQQRNANTGATDAGVAPQTAGALRENALKALSLAQQADIATANYTAAKDKAQQIIDLKYKPLEDKLAILQKQYEFNKENFTTADKARVEALQIALKKQETDLADSKSISLEASKNGATPDVINAIADAKTFNEKVAAAGQYLATSQNEFQKLDNGTTLLVDKRTGKIIKNYGGAKSTSTDGPISTTPIIRQVSLPDGTKQSVDGYTMVAGDDPYFIAQQNGIDMNKLQQLNPNITDWNNLPVGTILNIPNKTQNGSLLSATGLSQLAMEYLKTGSTALTRLDAKTRQAVFNEVSNYTKAKGIDEATFRQQYNAIGKTVEANTLRNNQSSVAESELNGTIDNLKSASQEANLGNLKYLNVAKIFAGTQLNDAKSQTFKFHLGQLRQELAMYNAALSGQIDANGNIRQIDDSDKKVAEDIIQAGFAAGSIDGFEKALANSTSKMRGVLQNSIDAQNKQVWKLFGVGDKYQSTINTPVTPNSSTLDSIWNQSTGNSTATNSTSILNNILNN